MRWNEQARHWEKHPDCRCDHDPCYCAWLRPLDGNGRPIPHVIIDGMREQQQPKKDAAA